MSLSSSVTLIYSLSGIGGQATITRTADGGTARDVTLNAATACVANTFAMTDSNTAACDLAAGHGLTNTNYDVYWSAGVRYGVAGGVTGNSIALEGGAGDDFPATNTAVTIAAQQEITVAITGNSASAIIAHPTVRAHVDFQDVNSASLWQHDITAAEALSWFSDSGIDNPLLSDTVAKVMASTASTTAGSIKIIVLDDATP